MSRKAIKYKNLSEKQKLAGVAADAEEALGEVVVKFIQKSKVDDEKASGEISAALLSKRDIKSFAVRRFIDSIDKPGVYAAAEQKSHSLQEQIRRQLRRAALA